MLTKAQKAILKTQITPMLDIVNQANGEVWEVAKERAEEFQKTAEEFRESMSKFRKDYFAASSNLMANFIDKARDKIAAGDDCLALSKETQNQMITMKKEYLRKLP